MVLLCIARQCFLLQLNHNTCISLKSQNHGFATRVLPTWNRLLADIVATSSKATFKKTLEAKCRYMYMEKTPIRRCTKNHFILNITCIKKTLTNRAVLKDLWWGGSLLQWNLLLLTIFLAETDKLQVFSTSPVIWHEMTAVAPRYTRVNARRGQTMSDPWITASGACGQPCMTQNH